MVKDPLGATARLNNIGIEYEKNGDVHNAIKTYEKNIKIGYPATHSYDRLMKIYRRLKMYDKERAVVEVAIQVFNKENERRFNMAMADERKVKYKEEIRSAMETNEKVMGDDGWYVFVPYDVMKYISRLHKVKSLIVKQIS